MTQDQERRMAAELRHLKEYIAQRQANDFDAGAVYDAMRELVLTPAQRYADEMVDALGFAAEISDEYSGHNPLTYVVESTFQPLLSKIKGEE